MELDTQSLEKNCTLFLFENNGVVYPKGFNFDNCGR